MPGVTLLTCVHEGLPDSPVAAHLELGWVSILSGLKTLVETGAPMVNITIGNPYFNPYVNRPFDLPISGAPVPPEHPLEGVARFLHIVKQVQQAYPDLPVVGGGYSWLRQFLPNVGAGFTQITD